MVATVHAQIDARRVDRLGALSDAVFAIAMTLMVIEFRLPAAAEIVTDNQFVDALAGSAPRFATYLVSFLALGVFWNGQHNQGNYFARADRGLAWITMFFLAVVAVLPFTTSLLADYLGLRAAFALYCIHLVVLGFAGYAAWAYTERAGLTVSGSGGEVGREILRRIAMFQALILVGLVAGLTLGVHVGMAVVFVCLALAALAPRIDPLRPIARMAARLRRT
jgi:uncharacterized membrane protein